MKALLDYQTFFKGDVVMFSFYGFAICKDMSNELKRHSFGHKAVVVDTAQPNHRRIDLTIKSFPKTTQYIKRLEDGLKEHQLMPKSYRYSGFRLDWYLRLKESYEGVYNEDMYPEYTVMLILGDGVDMYLRKQNSVRMILPTMGYCIFMKSPVSSFIKNVKQEGLIATLRTNTIRF